LVHDIIKAYRGELKVETKEGEIAEFIIQISKYLKVKKIQLTLIDFYTFEFNKK